MRRLGTPIAVLALLLTCLVPLRAARASGSAFIAALDPSAEVPTDVTVSFSVVATGFTNPTYYLVDSFPGGATTANISSGGDFSWTPNQDEVGTHNITVTVSDSQGDSATASQTITVDAGPQVTISAITPGSAVNIGTPLSFTASAAGLLLPAFSVGDSFSNSSVQMRAINSSGVFSWTPIAQDIGAHTLTITAQDNYGHSATASADITVLPATTVSISKLSPGSSVNAGEALTFSIGSTGFVNPVYAVSDGFSGVVTSPPTVDANGNVSWVPQYNDLGGHPLSITASDSGGRSQIISLLITVLPPNVVSTPPSVPVSTPSTPVTQTVTTPAQPIPPRSAGVTSQSSGTKTTSSSQTKPQVSNNYSSSLSSLPVTTTGTSSTNEAVPPPVFSEATGSVPSPASVPSFGQFLVGSVINFFASIFKFL